MDIALVAVGKLRPYYRQACDDYVRRLRRYTSLREYEVREGSRAPSPAIQRAEESARLEARIAEASTVVASAREGTGWASPGVGRPPQARGLFSARAGGLPRWSAGS